MPLNAYACHAYAEERLKHYMKITAGVIIKVSIFKTEIISVNVSEIKAVVFGGAFVGIC